MNPSKRRLTHKSRGKAGHEGDKKTSDPAGQRREKKLLRSRLNEARSKFELGIGYKGKIKVSLWARRSPVALYAIQWQMILNHADDIRQFIKANAGRIMWID